jgi:gliding motility-associated-like protein
MSLSAQTALYNGGNLRIHENGNLGFHTHLINNSPFDTNLGLAGFYSTESLLVSGTIVPLFYDVEIMAENGLNLSLGIDNANNTTFILGDIVTPKNQEAVYYNFSDTDGFYIGEGDLTKVNGYAAISNQQNFVFPIGDETYLRSLSLSSESTNLFAKCAYFFEDANTPISIAGRFNTNQLDWDLEFVSELEFWRLEGSVPSTISLNWNARSAIGSLTDDATKVVIVGWSKISDQWLNLGGNPVIGGLDQGFVTSDSFVPDEYEIITLGVSKIPFEPLSKEVLSLENYFVSVNGDGVNDSFFIPELLDYEGNFVQIYNRYGIKVFEMQNYTDEFNGFSNLNNVPFKQEKGLPIGVYFYTIYIAEADLSYQGFLYLAR